MRNSPLDLFEIDPEKILAAAALLREHLLQVSKPKTPEVTLRIALQGAIDDSAKSLGINLSWRDEYHMIEGRADTVYGGLVIEYEPPCSLRPSNKSATNAHALGQVRDYITGLQWRRRCDWDSKEHFIIFAPEVIGGSAFFEKDCLRFLALLKESLRRYEVELLSRWMHRLIGAYSISFNRRYKKSGHLFQGRYKSFEMLNV